MPSTPEPPFEARRAAPGPARHAALAAAACLLLGACSKGGGAGGGSTAPPAAGTPKGETPAILAHVDQADVDSGAIDLDLLLQRGEELFATAFNTLDGAGRPATDGAGNPRPPVFAPDNFNRISGPDASSCADCHGFPFVGSGGDNTTNVFVTAEAWPLVNFDGLAGDAFQDHDLDDVGNERNTVSVFGSGFVELLAREMTAELHALRDAALAEALSTASPVARNLVTKGVEFGQLTADPDGSLDTSAVEGVDADLIVKPFHQKGVVASLRHFTNSALNQHHGMQSSERFGSGLDPDLDGLVDEMTVGDVTALTLFQATRPAPGRVIPDDGAGGVSPAVEAGFQHFKDVGCADCHVPELELEDPVFTEPGPYNPPGNLQPGDVPQVLAVDLTSAGPGPFLTKEAGGSVRVPAFTDLKRHDMGAELDNEQVVQGGVPTSHFITRKLWGMANDGPFMHHGRALTLAEAILMHGGEAEASKQAFAALQEGEQDELVEFLLTLVQRAPGSAQLELQVPGPGPIGDQPGFTTHVTQQDIDNGVYTPQDLFLIGAAFFDNAVNTLDGAGRPATTGDGQPRAPFFAPQNFNRISGPEATRCVTCHRASEGGAGSGFTHSVEVLADSFPFVNFDGEYGDDFDPDLTLDTVGNERATVGVFGDGFIEMLGREMSVELRDLRDQALAQAQAAGLPVVQALTAKGVSFGDLVANPDGSLDTSGVQGVDADLIVKPFHQKGTVASLREFTTTALNQHMGIQAVERFGAGQDPDQDGVVDEMSVGDMTAFAAYMAMRRTPGRLLPSDPDALDAVEAGEAIFDAIGCATCHVPALVLDSALFTEPSPFNPPGNMTPDDIQVFSLDLTVEGLEPRLPKEPDGTVIVPAYTDLKRHDMGPGLAEPLPQGGAAPREFITKKLWGMANLPPYMHHGRALTITEAILMHGGEAQASRDLFEGLGSDQQASLIDFLKTLHTLPKGSPPVVFE